MNKDVESYITRLVMEATSEMLELADEPSSNAIIHYNNPFLMIVPVEHFFDPNDPQKGTLDSAWERFCTCTDTQKVAVIESGLRGIAATPEEAFLSEGGEGGYITYISYKAGIACACYEPARKDLLAKAAQSYSMDELFYATLMESVYQYNNGDTGTEQEEYLQYFVDSFNRDTGATYTAQDLPRIHQHYWNKPFDMLDWQTAYIVSNPYDESNPLQNLQLFIVQYRDIQIIKGFIQGYHTGYAQFAVYGSSHVWIYRRVLERYFQERT